jgi:type III secretory pathway component EscR
MQLVYSTEISSVFDVICEYIYAFSDLGTMFKILFILFIPCIVINLLKPSGNFTYHQV